MSHIYNPTIVNDSYFNYQELTDYLKQIHAKNRYCKFGVCQYTHGITAINQAYYGGVYSPTQNRIYLAPYNQSDKTNWHYIDCSTGNVVAYAWGGSAVNGAYMGGVYSPTQNRIYLVPYSQAAQSTWHYIQETSLAEIAPALMASAMFNKL